MASALVKEAFTIYKSVFLWIVSQEERKTKILFGFEGKLLGMFDGLDSYINIQIWPIKMTWSRLFDMKDLSHWIFLEPREILI